MINDAYNKMSREFNFTTIDASKPVDVQQKRVRRVVQKKIDLPAYKLKARSIV